MAQIAQTNFAGGMPGVWEAQQDVMRQVPKTGLAVSNDIYETTNGGFKTRVDDKTGLPIAGGGLTTTDQPPPNWFEIPDGAKFFQADASIMGNDSVVVTSQEVDKPVHVRFGWHALARFNLINKEGLPAVSSRTTRTD